MTSFWSEQNYWGDYFFLKFSSQRQAMCGCKTPKINTCCITMIRQTSGQYSYLSCKFVVTYMQKCLLHWKHRWNCTETVNTILRMIWKQMCVWISEQQHSGEQRVYVLRNETECRYFRHYYIFYGLMGSKFNNDHGLIFHYKMTAYFHRH